MFDPIRSFVIQQVNSVRRASSADGSLPLSMREAGSWIEAMEYASSVDAIFPFVQATQGAQWRSRIPHAVRMALFDEQRRQEEITSSIVSEAGLAVGGLVKAGIPVLAHGALDLAFRYYSKPGFRPVDGVDLAVNPEFRFDALRVLGTLGYRVAEAADVFRRGDSRPPVRLTLTLSPGEWVRSRPGALPLLPFEARTLSDEDVLLFLIRHAVRERGVDSPVWLNDAHFVVTRSGSLNWDQVLEGVSRERLAGAAWTLFELIRGEGESAIPPGVRKRLLKELSLFRRWRMPRGKNDSHSLFAGGGAGGLVRIMASRSQASSF